MSPSELAGFVPRRPNRSKDLAGLIELDNSIETTIDHPDMLIRCDIEPVRVADPRPLSQEAALGIKDLDSRVLAITDVDSVVPIDHDRMRQNELTRVRAV